MDRAGLVVVARRAPSPIWEDQVGSLSRMIACVTGNHAEVIDYTKTRFRSLVKSENDLVQSLRTEGVELVEGSARLLARPR